jgi:hypothetical protein
MTAPRVPESEFIELVRTLGVKETAKRIGVNRRNVQQRRDRIEQNSRVVVDSPHAHGTRARPAARTAVPGSHRYMLECWDGVVIVGSDAHYWPGIVTTAHRAFVRAAKELKPKAIILNGDVFDGAGISRHPSIGWESKPSVIQEIEACKERLGEIEAAAGNAKLIWTLGNHDARFETRLANAAPEYARVHGVHLKDHFPYWLNAWTCRINGAVEVKHRWKGGLHAPHNNAVQSGLSMVTGHLHSLKVTPWTDYTGTRYGVDCGTLAGPSEDPQFVNYTEAGPSNWRSGFAVLTFKDGRLLYPEVVHVFDEAQGLVEFRGKVYAV